jgi:hypothetical protein
MQKVRLAERLTSPGSEHQAGFAPPNELIQHCGHVWMNIVICGQLELERFS